MGATNVPCPVSGGSGSASTDVAAHPHGLDVLADRVARLGGDHRPDIDREPIRVADL